MTQSMTGNLAIDNDQIVLHIIKNTDLLTKYLAQSANYSTFDFPSFLDYCSDTIPDDAKDVYVIEANNSIGPFDITVSEYQGIFWVTEIEGDRIGYFLNLDDAKGEAEDYASLFQHYDSNDDSI